MKKIQIIVMLIFIGILLFGCYDKYFLDVNAKILTINDKIVYAQWVGDLLSSSSGYLTTDLIKVGVEIEINGKKYYADLKLNHAELASISNDNTIKLKIGSKIDSFGEHTQEINGHLYYCGRFVGDFRRGTYCPDLERSDSQDTR